MPLSSSYWLARRALLLLGLLAGLGAHGQALPEKPAIDQNSLPNQVLAQTRNMPGQPATLPGPVSLPQCLDFALRNQPAVRQAQLDERIGEHSIRLALADWLPQLNTTSNYTRNTQLPTVVVPNFTDPAGPPQLLSFGVKNLTTLGAQGTQTLFNTDVLRAARSVRDTRLANVQNTASTKINLVVDVSKAFYDVLLTQEQLRILEEAVLRQQRQLRDSQAKYEVGTTDKTDFLRAAISLKNALASRRTTAESLSEDHGQAQPDAPAPEGDQPPQNPPPTGSNGHGPATPPREKLVPAPALAHP